MGWIQPIVAPLRNRQFALLWSGQTVSNIGDNIYRVGFIWQVVALTGSATAVAAASVALIIPAVILLPFSGVIVDRLPRRAVMLTSEILRMLFLVVLTVLALSDQLQLWHLLLVSVLFGAADAFFQPAYTAIVPELVPAEVLVRANALSGIGRQSALILGPILGGLIVQQFGPAVVFGIDALSFLLSAVSLLLLPSRQISPPAPDGVTDSSNMFSEARAGLRYVLSIPWLWITIAVAAIGNTAVIGAIDVGLPFLVTDALSQQAGLLGLIYTLHGVGALIGGLLMAHIGAIPRPGIFAYSALVALGLSLVATGLLPLVGVVTVMALLYGISYQIFGIIWTSTLQQAVPQHLLGRVSSVDYLGSYGLVPVGAGLTGLAVAHLGAGTTFLLAGGVIVGVAMLGLLSSSVRQLTLHHDAPEPSIKVER